MCIRAVYQMFMLSTSGASLSLEVVMGGLVLAMLRFKNLSVSVCGAACPFQCRDCWDILRSLPT